MADLMMGISHAERAVLRQALHEYQVLLKLNLNDEDEEIRLDAANDLDVLEGLLVKL